MLLRSILNTSFFLSLLVVSVLVIVTSGKATADRPTSSITEDLPDWFSNDEANVEIKWKASHEEKIDRIYFWACYYENEGD